MKTEELDIFLKLLFQALNNIKSAYFSMHYNNATDLLNMQPIEGRSNVRKKRMGSAIVQTGERIFCYELYHQLRILLDHEDHRHIFQNVCLQGELKKTQILAILESFQLTALSRNFIPDFLLHSPGTAEFHPYVIEVKADRLLTWKQIKNDLSKIVEFMTNYHYQRGIFIATAIEVDRLIKNRISKNPFLDHIPQLATHAENIYIFCRENEEKLTYYDKLANIWQPKQFNVMY